MEYFLIAFGLLIIILSFFDFFHTTLSGNGYWFISASVNNYLSKLILRNKSRTFFDYSGLIHILITALTWLSLLMLGAFIIFTSGEQMVLNGQTRMPADLVDRFYFTSYVLSTLGVGDFVPGNEMSQVLTGLLSFSGFIMLTTGLTYLLNVVNSVLEKKKLALVISTLGDDLEQLYQYMKIEEGTLFKDKSDSLRQSILINSSNFLAFPIINHFMTRKRSHATEIQLATLYEVFMAVRNDFPEKSVQRAEINTILSAVESYLNLGLEAEEDFHFDPDRLQELRLFWSLRGMQYEANPWKDRIINAALKSAGWSWEDVYVLKEAD